MDDYRREMFETMERIAAEQRMRRHRPQPPRNTLVVKFGQVRPDMEVYVPAKWPRWEKDFGAAKLPCVTAYFRE